MFTLSFSRGGAPKNNHFCNNVKFEPCYSSHHNYVGLSDYLAVFALIESDLEQIKPCRGCLPIAIDSDKHITKHRLYEVIFASLSQARMHLFAHLFTSFSFSLSIYRLQTNLRLSARISC